MVTRPCSQRSARQVWRGANGAITPIGNYVAIKRFKDLTPTGRERRRGELPPTSVAKLQLECRPASGDDV